MLKILKKIFAIILTVILLAGCKAQQTANTQKYTAKQILKVKTEIISHSDNLDTYTEKFFDEVYIDWLCEEFGEEILFKLNNALKNGILTNEYWYDLTGNTATVLYDMFSGALDKDSPNFRSDIYVINSTSKDTTIRIVGDISFADNWQIAPKIDSKNKGVLGVLSEDTVSLLKNANIFLANNEFTYSDRGEPIKGKMYTFRAKPERVNLMKEIGADIVSLANNHAYDYGADAFSDTLKTLKDANLPYIGAGENLEEASKPVYFIVNGRKYAFSAATRAEKTILTPEATETSSGVLRTYDPEKYIEVLKTAEMQTDYNIAYLHWGAEGSHKTEEGLYEMGSKFIDAGADVVVGAHAHVLQGIDFYKDVPIIYNLGNFIFNSKTIDTGIFEIKISKEGNITYKFIPAIQKNCYTSLVDGAQKQRILKFLSSLSPNVNIDENGIITNGITSKK